MSVLTQKSYFPWLCWASVTLVYVLQYGLLVIPESLVQEISTSFNIGLAQVGVYSSMFLYAWIIMQIPAGIMFDHYDSRKLMFASTLVIVLACVIQGFTTNYSVALLSRALMGAGGAFSFVGAVYLARAWFPVTMLALVIGITEAASGVSEIGFPVLFANLTANVSWRAIMFFIGMIALGFAFLTLFFVRDKPKESRSKHRRSTRIDLKTVFSNKYLWGLGLYVGFAGAYYFAVIDMWGVVWLRRQFNLSTTQAVYLNAAAILGFMIGCPVIGWLARFMARRYLIMICMLAEYVMLYLTDFWMHTTESHACSLVLLGFFTGGIVLAFDMAKELVAELHYGLAVGFLNMFFGLIGVIMTPIMGYILMLNTGEVVYKLLTMQLTGAIGAIVSIFIACLYKFDKKEESEKN